MIRPSADIRIHLYWQPLDMRKAINGVVSVVEGEMAQDPFSADLYILCNRARTLVKMIAQEGNGFVLCMTRLEQSRFKWPLSGSEAVLQLTVQEINWLLDGQPLTVTQANGSLLHHRVTVDGPATQRQRDEGRHGGPAGQRRQAPSAGSRATETARAPVDVHRPALGTDQAGPPPALRHPQRALLDLPAGAGL